MLQQDLELALTCAMHFEPAAAGQRGEYPMPEGAAEDLVAAHARSLQRAVAGEFARETRRTPFATPAGVGTLAATILRQFGEDLLNDLLMIAERLPARARTPWAMVRLAEALMDAADALEEAAPPAMRQSVASTLQICRVDLEWRCRTALGLPSPTGGAEEDLFDRGGIW